jgi:hypothetical protein
MMVRRYHHCATERFECWLAYKNSEAHNTNYAPTVHFIGTKVDYDRYVAEQQRQVRDAWRWWLTAIAVVLVAIAVFSRIPW